MTRTRSNPEESRVRAIFRAYGFRVESVSWIRAQHEGEFLNVVVWPAKEAYKTIEFFTRKDNTLMEITRVHVGDPGPDGNQAVRIYFRFDMSCPVCGGHIVQEPKPGCHRNDFHLTFNGDQLPRRLPRGEAP